MQAIKPATIFLPNGYNGHTVECLAEPIAHDGDLLKLRVYGSEYLIRWVGRAEYDNALAASIPTQEGR